MLSSFIFLRLIIPLLLSFVKLLHVASFRPDVNLWGCLEVRIKELANPLKTTFCYFFVPCGKFGSLYLDKTQQPQEQRYPFLSVCAVLSVCPNDGVAARVWDLLTCALSVDACDCTRRLYGQRKRVCTGNLTLEEKSLAAPGTRNGVNIAPVFFSQTIN